MSNKIGFIVFYSIIAFLCFVVIRIGILINAIVFWIGWNWAWLGPIAGALIWLSGPWEFGSRKELYVKFIKFNEERVRKGQSRLTYDGFRAFARHYNADGSRRGLWNDDGDGGIRPDPEAMSLFGSRANRIGHERKKLIEEEAKEQRFGMF